MTSLWITLSPTIEDMDVKEFIAAYREAFGERPELPLLFRYTDSPMRPVEQVGGCFFKALAEALHGIQPDARIRSAVRVAQGAL